MEEPLKTNGFISLVACFVALIAGIVCVTTDKEIFDVPQTQNFFIWGWDVVSHAWQVSTWYKVWIIAMIVGAFTHENGLGAQLSTGFIVFVIAMCMAQPLNVFALVGFTAGAPIALALAIFLVPLPFWGIACIFSKDSREKFLNFFKETK